MSLKSPNALSRLLRKIPALTTAPTPDDMYPLEPYTAPGKTDLAPDLTNDLQYTMNYGIPYWREFFTEHVRRMHNPPYADWAVHMSNGCADGTQGALTTLVSFGDTVLVEEFGKSSQLAKAYGANV